MTSPVARLTSALADRYRLGRELGQGGMATVYLAEDLRHGRKVAIKVLHPELSAVLGGERFLAEIKVTANLQHPHILGLIDSGEADGLLYYVMPYVAGESLRARLARERQLPVEEALRLAREVASALDYAHRQGVVHRDIKPENILLQDGAALVADFGIALAVQQAGGSRMTQTGMSLGTPAYMSPEQAMGEREIGARSDVYALGAMTYEMLAGEPPFTGPNSQAIVAKVLTEQPPPLRPKRPTVPPAAEAAILTALQKLPADRWGYREGVQRRAERDRARSERRPPPTVPMAAARAPARERAPARPSRWPAGWWRRRRRRRRLGAAPAAPRAPAVASRDPGARAGRKRCQLVAAPPDVPARRQAAGVLDGRLGRDPPAGPPVARRRVPTPIPGAVKHEQSAGVARRPVARGDARACKRQVLRLPLDGGSAGAGGPTLLTLGRRGVGTGRHALVQRADARARAGRWGTRSWPGLRGRPAAGSSRSCPTVAPRSSCAPGSATPPAPVLLVDLQNGAETPLLGTPVHRGAGDAGLAGVRDPGRQPAGRAARSGRPAGQRAAGDGGDQRGGHRARRWPSSRWRRQRQPRLRPGGAVVAGLRRPGGREPARDAERRNFHHPMFSPDGRRLSLDFNSVEGRNVWILGLAEGTLSRATFDRDGHDATWTPDGRFITYIVPVARAAA